MTDSKLFGAALEKAIRRWPDLLTMDDICSGMPPKERWLPVDDALTKLSARSRPPRLKTDEDIRNSYPDLMWFGAHINTRMALFAYVFIGMKDHRFDQSVAADWDRNDRMLSDIERSIRAYLDETEYHLEGEVSREEYPALATMDLLAAALPGLQELRAGAAEFRDAYAPPGGGQPKERWKYDFVNFLWVPWSLMTGREPSRSPIGPFADFVAEAWASLGEEMPSVNWDSALKRSRLDNWGMDLVSANKAFVTFVFRGPELFTEPAPKRAEVPTSTKL